MSIEVPGKIICVGRNYAAHARELGNEVPAEPMIFLKPPSAVVQNGAAIVLPRHAGRIEFEGEIGVVIGTRIRHASREAAEQAIAGFTCVNDVSARELQQRDKQWGRAKGFDTFCPVGPRLATVLDWRSLEVFARLNGELRQHGRSADMEFDIPTIIAFVSGVMTLEPGDLIATGTPAGTAALSPGDVIEIEIPGVGILRNSVVSE